MKYVFTSCLCFLLAAYTCAQPLSLQACYKMAEQNYPLIRQYEVIARSNGYTIQNLSKATLPQLTVNAQATYQSDVTRVPITLPGMEIPTLSKEQYKVYSEITQTVYDGGMTSAQKRFQNAGIKVEEQTLAVELYKLKERINQLFFGILLVDQQIQQVELVKSDIEIGLRKTQAAQANGTAFKSSVDVLRAELLKTSQRSTELAAMRNAYTEMLGLFIGREGTSINNLERPDAVEVLRDIYRPELALYEQQTQRLAGQDRINNARNLPRLSLFIQAGYGRPGLNMLSNDFDSYYLGGLRLNWSLSGLYTLKHDRDLVNVSRRNIAIQKETFLFNTRLAVRQQDADIAKYQTLLMSDDEIIVLRTSVKNAATAQLENGVINASDYLREVNAEDQAKQNKIVHEIQWLMAQYTRQNTNGTLD